MRDLGGSAHPQQVLTKMENLLKDEFSPSDIHRRSTGEIGWRHKSHRERIRMIEEGILKNDSPRGIWELSEGYL